MGVFGLGSLASSLTLSTYRLSRTLVRRVDTLLHTKLYLRFSSDRTGSSSAMAGTKMRTVHHYVRHNRVRPRHPLIVLAISALLRPRGVRYCIPISCSRVGSAYRSFNVGLVVGVISPPVRRRLVILFTKIRGLFSSSVSKEDNSYDIV